MPPRQRNRIKLRFGMEQIIPSVASAVSLLVAALGLLLLGMNNLDSFAVPGLVSLALSLGMLGIQVGREFRALDRTLLLLVGLSLVGIGLLEVVPEYMYGLEIHGLIHHSVVSAIVLLGLAVPASCQALYYLLGATPTAYDLSRYPLIVVPIALALLTYALLVGRLISLGLPQLDLKVITTPFRLLEYQVGLIDRGWPIWTTVKVEQAGMLNHLLGSGMLTLLTSLISLPFGVGTGIYLSEYARGWTARVFRFSVTALRAISEYILALTFVSLVQFSSGTVLSDLIRGFYFDTHGMKVPAAGSFLAASLVMSLLVTPIITRATEEGCRSLPHDLREGSWALGATEGYTLGRIVLPWALPNIITALLLGCAEAVGSVAVIMLVAGWGQDGVSPLSQVTSLAYLILDAGYGRLPFRQMMGDYQYAAALMLLVVALGLTIIGLVLRKMFNRRYRGAS